MAPKRQRFAQRRKAVGFTQESFAERLGVDRNTVVRWEGGVTEPQPWMRPRIARALEVSADELDRLLTSEAQSCAVLGASPDEFLLGRKDDDSGSVLDGILEERPSVEDVQAAVHRMRSAYSSADPATLHRQARDRLGQIRRMLPAEATSSTQNTLLESAAWLAVLDGTVLADLHAREAAEDAVLTARRIAQQLGHAEIVAWTYETAAWMAVTDGQFLRALPIVEAGVDVAPRGGFGLVAALGQRARVHACLGEERRLVEDLRDAESALATVGDPPDPADHYFSGPGQAIYFGARAFARLGRPAETIEHAAEVVRLSQDPAEPQYCPTRALNARLEWAWALVQSGDEDAGYAKALERFDPVWWRPGTAQRTRTLLTCMRDPRLRSDLAEQLRPLP